MSIRNSFIVTILAVSSLTFGIGGSEVLAKPTDSYIGVGARAPLQDENAVILNAKFKLIDFGNVSVAGRPAIFLGRFTELRFALTGETEIAPGWTPFLGVGVATNTDGSGEVNSMFAGGLDLQISEKVVLQIGGNWIFQSDDSDREITATINYLF